MARALSMIGPQNKNACLNMQREHMTHHPEPRGRYPWSLLLFACLIHATVKQGQRIHDCQKSCNAMKMKTRRDNEHSMVHWLRTFMFPITSHRTDLKCPFDDEIVRDVHWPPS